MTDRFEPDVRGLEVVTVDCLEIQEKRILNNLGIPNLHFDHVSIPENHFADRPCHHYCRSWSQSLNANCRVDRNLSSLAGPYHEIESRSWINRRTVGSIRKSVEHQAFQTAAPSEPKSR
jgi:hypothetical protein